MPPLNGDDDAGFVDPSPGTIPETTDAAVKPADDAQSPGATDDPSKTDEPKSMADAITAALDAETDEGDGVSGDTPAAEPKTDDATGKDGEPKATVEADKAETDPFADDPTDDELKAYKPKVQQRIKKLLHQRNTALREGEASSEDANHYRNIRGFMAEVGLQDAEMADLFKFGAMVKSSDPSQLETALAMIAPIYENLLAITGRTVPSDLRPKVDSGEITEELALQQAKDRNARHLAEQRVQRTEGKVAEQQTATQVATAAKAIRDAVGVWHEQVRKTDPDFGKKTDALNDAAIAIVAQRGHPKTAAEAVEFAKEAYSRVSKFYEGARPARKATRPVPDVGSNGNRASAQPAPTSLQEAILAGLRA